MWENWEVRIDLTKKISWLRPCKGCKSGANLLGPTLPRAMLRFWCALKAFLKRLVCALAILCILAKGFYSSTGNRSQQAWITYTYLACSRLSDSGEDAKGKGTRFPSFLPFFFFFRVCAFSIQQTRLSRSLEQANTYLKRIAQRTNDVRVAKET